MTLVVLLTHSEYNVPANFFCFAFLRMEVWLDGTHVYTPHNYFELISFETETFNQSKKQNREDVKCPIIQASHCNISWMKLVSMLSVSLMICMQIYHLNNWRAQIWQIGRYAAK